RGMLNAGHRRGAIAGRCVVVGKTVMTEELPAYCGVAVAGLGNLPDSILTRSVIVKMRRRSPNESVEPYRRRLHAPEGHVLRARLADWIGKITSSLALARPEMPPGVEDRAADVWEALLAMAKSASQTSAARSSTPGGISGRASAKLLVILPIQSARRARNTCPSG